ncbi:hypothetical protein CEXT_789001 [Caerostris extrusa]|uniref:Uncharacterized protein n=1 Tax=Caerostris extrusa TaxID=172846 RepID=A0AAV4MNP5_CAEEX|nr:hypothetical protein CEXT_789001 [Caerostris extrusa]
MHLKELQKYTLKPFIPYSRYHASLQKNHSFLINLFHSSKPQEYISKNIHFIPYGMLSKPQVSKEPFFCDVCIAQEIPPELSPSSSFHHLE